MQKLGNAAANVVARLKVRGDAKAAPEAADPDRVAEKAIVGFFRAQHVEMLQHNGAVFLAGQFWTTIRAGRLITSMHLTDLAEQIVTQLQFSQRR
jgi:hypothetical protein